MIVSLNYHKYKYYEYEQELALRELKSLCPGVSLRIAKSNVVLEGEIDLSVLDRLVYYSSYTVDSSETLTRQAKLEATNGSTQKRQSTRYSAHGIHEYKGRFNPQVVHALLNIFLVKNGQRVIDPFCGSGTSLLECSHFGLKAIGIDVNPLAVYVANTKQSLMLAPPSKLRNELTKILKEYEHCDVGFRAEMPTEREEYLAKWFELSILNSIEKLRQVILSSGIQFTDVFQVIASNLLREYSLQDPNDLRVRRRKTSLPQKPFILAFEESASKILMKMESALQVLPGNLQRNKAIHADIRTANLSDFDDVCKPFDFAVTSPPYATALPYIDTQRLSLVWLQLIAPSDIRPLEAGLVGSRELRGKSKKAMRDNMISNSASIPKKQLEYCLGLDMAIGETDGFRRQAVPLLLYRYFDDMSRMFRNLRQYMKPDAHYALIVGCNHTTLDGKRFDIDTPGHLVELAESTGWVSVESTELQTYQRYGYHMKNAVRAEKLIVLRSE